MAPASNPPANPSRESRPRLNNSHSSPIAAVYPQGRYSLPETESSTYSTTHPYHSPLPSPSLENISTMSNPWHDRLSSSSLPLPSQIPYYALPRANPDSNSASSERNSPRCPTVASSSSSSSSSSDSDSIATTNTSLNTDQSSPPYDKPSFTSGPSTSSRDENRPVPHSPPFQSTSDFSMAMRRLMGPPRNPNTSAYLPPEPPVILTEPVPDTTQPTSRPHAYFPFLNHAPPPPDSWIEVETTLSEYKLHVHLPGFTRDGITLATRRRRILHVVADSWENNGGHFERRISFGYDADLIQVRAEFDGVMLRIIIPRRISPVTLLSPSPHPGPTGRR